MEIKIEKGIPIPEVVGTARTGLNDALRQLEIGDSFLYEDVRPGQAGNICNAARYIGIRVTTRKEGDNRRIWRIA